MRVRESERWESKAGVYQTSTSIVTQLFTEGEGEGGVMGVREIESERDRERGNEE